MQENRDYKLIRKLTIDNLSRPIVFKASPRGNLNPLASYSAMDSTCFTDTYFSLLKPKAQGLLKRSFIKSLTRC